MSKRIRFHLPDWEAGRKFINHISESLSSPIDEREDVLIITAEGAKFSCQFTEDGTSFIMIKYTDSSYEEKYKQFYSAYI
ncbi:MAG: hypothetical protein INQ03_19275 [Candidatus Heimdallarchaeota archaeon]|nr:hypothetical protein [Candidatus Heimdallarchaeota archaeon]